MDRQPTQERAPRAARPANANRRRRKVIPGLFSKFVVAVCAILPAVALLPVLKIPVIKRILDRL